MQGIWVEKAGSCITQVAWLPIALPMQSNRVHARYGTLQGISPSQPQVAGYPLAGLPLVVLAELLGEASMLLLPASCLWQLWCCYGVHLIKES